MTPDQARVRARKALVTVADGGDPVAERHAERARVTTVKRLAEAYIERHAKPHRKSWKEDKRRSEKYIVPALGHLVLKDVRRSDIAALHAKIGTAAPVEANRVVQLLRAMFNKAIAWGDLPEGARNPAEMDRRGDRGVRAFRERPRERWVTPAEMPKLLEAIGSEENVFIRAAFRLYLLTGLRKNELLRSKWDDIDLECGQWRVARKGGDTDVVPLVGPAVEILRSLPRYRENPHVFPGHKRGTHLVNIDKNWQAIREKAGREDVTIHDLRRSVGSWMATAGVSLQIIGQVLGHAPDDVKATAIYARLARDAARGALEDYAARLMAAENGGAS